LTGSGSGATFVWNGNGSSSILIPGEGRFSVQASMRAPVVVIVDELSEPFTQHISVFSRTKINIFLFECMPEPLDPDVVNCPVPAVHADGYFLFFKIFNPSGTSELRALVRVYNLWLAMLGDCFTKHLQAVLCIQRVRYVPVNDITAIHINDGRHIQKSLFHGDVRDIYAPNMVRMGDLMATCALKAAVCFFLVVMMGKINSFY